MDTRPNEEMELDLRGIFQILKKRRLLIISITLIAALASGIVSSFVVTPVYQASTEILVNKSEDGQGLVYNINDVNTNLKLISTYSVIIKSPRIMDLVIEDYNLSLTSEQLISKVTINSVKDSQVMKISVQDTDQKEAARLANAIANTFQREIIEIMNVDNVQILNEAKALNNPSPVKPNITLNILIASVLSLLTAVSLSFLLEYLDNTIKSEQEIERLLGYPVLGIIGTIDEEKIDKKFMFRVLTSRGETNDF